MIEQTKDNTQYYKCYYVESSAPKLEPVYTYTTPAKTTIKTTIDLNTAPSVSSYDHHHHQNYYSNAYHLPMINATHKSSGKQVSYAPAKTVTTYVRKDAGYTVPQPPATKTVEYTTAAPTGNYYCQPIYRTKSYSNLCYD